MKFWITAIAICLNTGFTQPLAYATRTKERDNRYRPQSLRYNSFPISTAHAASNTAHEASIVDLMEGESSFQNLDGGVVSKRNETMDEAHDLFNIDASSPARDLESVSISEGADFVPCLANWRWRIFAEDTDLVGSPLWDVCELEFYADSSCTELVASSGKAPIYFASGSGDIKQQAPLAFDEDTDTCWPGEYQQKKEFFIGYNQGLADVTVRCMKLTQGPNNYMTKLKVQYKQGQWKDQFEIDGIGPSDTMFVLDSTSDACPELPAQALTCGQYDFIETTGGGIDAHSMDQEYGSSVSISGDGQRAAVSGSVSNIFGPTQGLAEVWEYDGSTWEQLGQTILTDDVSVRVSAEVELSGDGSTLAFATVYNDEQDVSVGAVTIYFYNVNKKWIMRGDPITGGVAGNRAGLKVSLDDNGQIIAIGSRYYSSNSDLEVGRARVFQYDSGNDVWSQLGSDITGDTAEDHVGSSVAIAPDGLHLAVGATGYDYFDGASMVDVGYVRVFSYDGSEWVQLGNDVVGEGAGDKSGFSVAIAATSALLRIAVGAIFNDGNGIDAGHARVYDFDSVQGIWVQAGSDIDGQNGLVLDEDTFYYHVGTFFVCFLFHVYFVCPRIILLFSHLKFYFLFLKQVIEQVLA